MYGVQDPGDVGELLLADAVKGGSLSEASARQAVEWLDDEISRLIAAIKACGRQSPDGHYEVLFGVLYEKTNTIVEVRLQLGGVALVRGKGRDTARLPTEGKVADLVVQIWLSKFFNC